MKQTSPQYNPVPCFTEGIKIIIKFTYFPEKRNILNLIYLFPSQEQKYPEQTLIHIFKKRLSPILQRTEAHTSIHSLPLIQIKVVLGAGGYTRAGCTLDRSPIYCRANRLPCFTEGMAVARQCAVPGFLQMSRSAFRSDQIR